MTSFEKSVVAALCILPYTALRFGILGFGEVILIFLFFSELKNGPRNVHINNYTFSKFWIHLIVVSLIGLLFNVFVLGYATGTAKGVAFDTAAYILLLMSVYSFENHRKRTPVNCYNILKYAFIFSSLFLLIIFVISRFTPSILGFSIKYYNYFAPLSNNLHQTAMFITPLPFIGLFLLEKEPKKLMKLFFICMIPAMFYLGLETGSFKARSGLFLGLIVYLSLWPVFKFKGDLRRLTIVLLIFGAFIAVSINLEFIYDTLIEIFQEEDSGEGRSFLYSKALDVGMTSPLVGLGAGPHVFGKIAFWDTHQTMLTIFLQAGIVGLVLFLMLIFKIVRKLITNPAIFAAFIPISVYFLGGDILRRLPIWIMLILFFYQTNEAVTVKKLIK